MVGIKKVVVLIPCYNEEEGIGMVIESIPQEQLERSGYAVSILVIDNNSKDKTAAVALSKGASVVKETKQGKGCAIMKGFKSVPSDTDIVVMIDGDASYDLRELPRLIEPIGSGFADAIVGTRLNGKITSHAMKGFNRFGNWLFTFLARVSYKTNVTDVCSGFFAWKKSVVDDLAYVLRSDGFSIEMEMIAKMARMDYACYSVPISYKLRNGKSNLAPLKDGARILYTWAKYLAWKPKIFPNTQAVPLTQEVSNYTINEMNPLAQQDAEPQKVEAS